MTFFSCLSFLSGFLRCFDARTMGFGWTEDEVLRDSLGAVRALHSLPQPPGVYSFWGTGVF
jgi:hypothetical protein